MAAEDSVMRLARAVVRAAARLVPRDERDRWAQEWEAEILHRASAGALGPRESFTLFRRSLGAVPHALWHLREAFRWDSLSQDTRQAARSLRTRPGFVLAASMTLATGIAATTTLFSVVDAILLEPLPYPDPERLVAVFETNEDVGRDSSRRSDPSPANVLDWRRESRTLEGIAAWWIRSEILLADGGNEAEEVPSASVTVDFFPILKVQPLLGRTFTPREVAEGEKVFVASYELWQRRFGGASDAVGRDVRFKDGVFRMIGILPPSFRTPETLAGEVQLFRPWDLDRRYAGVANRARDHRFLESAARLAPGVPLDEARAEMAALAKELAERYPETNAGWSVELVPLREVVVGEIEPALLVLSGAVSFVLLLACANVTGLLLVRSSTRSREMAVRTALGASRKRIARQLVLESLLLGAGGGLAGLVLSFLGVRALSLFAPEGLFPWGGARLDSRALVFAIGMSILAGLASGLVPALQSSTREPAESLRTSGVAASDRKRLRLRTAIVSLEVAAAVMLLIGSVLFLSSFARLVDVDPGFSPRNVLIARVRLQGEKYGHGGAHRYYTELLEKLRAIPGVVSAGGVTALPIDPVDVDFDRPFWRDGEPRPPGGGPGVRIRMPTVGYFETMRIPLLAGRLFDERDDGTRPRVLLVNESMAEMTWPKESPLGKRLRFDYGDYDGLYEVVGVVGNTRFEGYRSEPEPEVYIPHAQNPYLPLNLVLRYESSFEALAPAVRATLLAIDPDQPVHSLEDMETLAGRTLGEDRFTTFVMTLFGAAALLLATIGLYSVTAQSVSQRQREIGLRVALGADDEKVVRLVLGSGLRVALSGCAIGLAGAVILGRSVTAVLFQVSPLDPTSLALAVATAMATVLLASYLPARRAARLDPVRALQTE